MSRGWTQRRAARVKARLSRGSLRQRCCRQQLCAKKQVSPPSLGIEAPTRVQFQNAGEVRRRHGELQSSDVYWKSTAARWSLVSEKRRGTVVRTRKRGRIAQVRLQQSHPKFSPSQGKYVLQRCRQSALPPLNGRGVRTGSQHSFQSFATYPPQQDVPLHLGAK